MYQVSDIKKELIAAEKCDVTARYLGANFTLHNNKFKPVVRGAILLRNYKKYTKMCQILGYVYCFNYS